MMKKFLGKILLVLTIFILIITQGFPLFANAESDYLFLSGEIFGFDFVTEGQTVVALSDVITFNGVYSPAKDVGIEVGDVITKINGNMIYSNEDLDKFLSTSPNVVEISRNGDIKCSVFNGVEDINGKIRIGVFTQNDFCGIGTVTFYTKNHEFGALGHSVTVENYTPKIVGGNLNGAYITSIIKGERNIIGEIRGLLKKNNDLGEIYYGTKNGIYGKKYDLNEELYTKSEIADENEMKIGSAKIYSDVSGVGEYYKISIVKINKNSDEKNFVIKVDDEKLLSLTGGIIQGMSGSPILQNGKIVGAVTHVFKCDSTRGYGIMISKMLDNLK